MMKTPFMIVHFCAERRGRSEFPADALIAFLAVQRLAKPRTAAFFGEHPFADAKRRIVPHVLVVPAFEHCDPMSHFIHNKTCNDTLHGSLLFVILCS